MALEAIINNGEVYKVILEGRAEGVYVLVFKDSKSPFPYRDNLQADLDMAKRACFIDYKVSHDGWHEVPDSDLV